MEDSTEGAEKIELGHYPGTFPVDVTERARLVWLSMFAFYLVWPYMGLGAALLPGVAGAQVRSSIASVALTAYAAPGVRWSGAGPEMGLVAAGRPRR